MALCVQLFVHVLCLGKPLAGDPTLFSQGFEVLSQTPPSPSAISSVAAAVLIHAYEPRLCEPSVVLRVGHAVHAAPSEVVQSNPHKHVPTTMAQAPGVLRLIQAQYKAEERNNQ